MSSRIARLVFGLLPARAAEFGDACVAEAPLPPAQNRAAGPAATKAPVRRSAGRASAKRKRGCSDRSLRTP